MKPSLALSSSFRTPERVPFLFFFAKCNTARHISRKRWAWHEDPLGRAKRRRARRTLHARVRQGGLTDNQSSRIASYAHKRYRPVVIAYLVCGASIRVIWKLAIATTCASSWISGYDARRVRFSAFSTSASFSNLVARNLTERHSMVCTYSGFPL